MDFSYVNRGLWDVFVWGGVIAGLLLLSNVLTRKIGFVRKSLMPVAALAGFILLGLRAAGVFKIPSNVLEMVTYHGIALGFIAMALRTVKKGVGSLFAFKSGALIVSTYLMQAMVGLVISIVLAYTVMPQLFKAAGILLPMAYGQGPGQANNVGSTYEALGFMGARSFGLSLAAAGYLTACVIGILYTRRVIKRLGGVRQEVAPLSGSVMTEAFEDTNEVPLSESMDRLSIQIALILLAYLITYVITRGIAQGLMSVAPGFAATFTPLLWGFNFITGSLVGVGMRGVMTRLQKAKLMNRQYQNNYLLNRISGLAFDVMIVAGIASINISDLQGLLVPFLLMAVFGGISTYVYLKWITPRLTPNYQEEAFAAMFGMMTGTISSGILLLRQIDPEFKTPAANQLVVGSGTGILFGAPILIMVGLAPRSVGMLFLTFGLCIAYMALLVWFMIGKRREKRPE